MFVNKLKQHKNTLEKLILLLLVVFAMYITFHRLGDSYLENWDEAWYGDVIRNILRQREFIVLYWNRRVFIDKPPLFMWIGFLVSNLIGLSEFSLRLPSAVAGFIIIICVLAYSYKNFGFIPSLLAFSTLALNNVFIWRARSANIDVFVTLPVLLTYFIILEKSKLKYPILGILFATIYLTKASLVFFPLGIFFIHELFFEHRHLKKNMLNYLITIISFVFPAGLWLLLGCLALGRSFATYFLFKSDQSAAAFSLLNFKLNYLKYAYYSLQRRFFLVLLLGLLFSIRKIRDAKFFLLILYSCLLLVLISFGKKDNNWYLIPSMPFWSILIAYGTYSFLNLFNRYKLIKYATGMGVLLLSFYVSYKTYIINIRPIIYSQTTLNQGKASLYLKKMTNDDEVIARLDQLYPTTIFYSDRLVYSSSLDSKTDWIFLSREDLFRKIETEEIKWIIGKQEDVNKFTTSLSPRSWQIALTEGDEQVLKIK